MPRPAADYDFIIVGAGPAGCLLANRLSADPAHRVLLLEAGGRDNHPWIHIPVGYLFCIGNPRTDWCFKTEVEAGLGGRALNYPRGRVLGGCSSINGMIYMRGQARDYDGWAAAGNPGWAWQDVLPLFKAMEDHCDGASAFHGAGGEWRVERQRLHWTLLDAFRSAAGETGIAPVEDFNTGDNEGCGYFQVNQRNGVRWNAAKAFLRPIRQRANLEVLTGVQVERVLLEEGRARAVLARLPGQTAAQRLVARREIVLCAGAIGSPTLLQRSGIGPRALLEGLGIGVQHRLEGVGGNLQDHLQLRLIYRVKGVPTLNALAGSLWGKLGMGLEYLWRRSGPLAMAPSQLGAFARSDPGQPSANLQYHVQPLSLERFGEPLHGFPRLHRLGLQPAPGQSRSGGHPQCRPAGGAADPAALPERGGRPQGGRRRHPPDPAHRRRPSPGRLPTRGIPAGTGLPKRRGVAAGRGRHRHHHLPPLRHLPHGAGCRRRGGRPPASAWHPRPAGRRRLHHADPGLRQQLFADPDDRRAGGPLHAGRGAGAGNRRVARGGSPGRIGSRRPSVTDGGAPAVSTVVAVAHNNNWRPALPGQENVRCQTMPKPGYNPPRSSVAAKNAR
ncbi:choline dehydrogenase-like flavoprotein [Pseudomonas psychrotolerans]|nr:choline dehydrogenase-like flavoprotein [Pseudomonas psychrotolerans]